MRVAIALLLGLAALAVAGPASAAEITARDDEGRPIHFDVRAEGVSVEWYADLLRAAAHADEISRVTIRIVDWQGLRESCGHAAAGCYSRRGGRDLLIVPAGEGRRVARTLIHEYGHHVDASRRHSGLREPNGTPLWWRARGMDELVQLRSVARTYRIGWDRSIAEIFAEDYAFTNLGGSYRIRWLDAPTATVRAAIRADLGLEPAPTIRPVRTVLKPVVIERNGLLGPAERESVRFGLLGPGRRVTLAGVLRGPGAEDASSRLDVECDGAVRSRAISGARRSARIDLRGLGPAECRASLFNTGARVERFRFTVTLSVRG